MGYHWNHLDDLMVWLKIITRLVRLTKQGATCWGLRQLGFLAVGCVELLETSGRWRCSFVPGSSCTSHLAGWMPSGVATNSIFFCFLFAKKIIDLPGGKINDPSLGKILFSFVPPPRFVKRSGARRAPGPEGPAPKISIFGLAKVRPKLRKFQFFGPLACPRNDQKSPNFENLDFWGTWDHLHTKKGQISKISNFWSPDSLPVPKNQKFRKFQWTGHHHMIRGHTLEKKKAPAQLPIHLLPPPPHCPHSVHWWLCWCDKVLTFSSLLSTVLYCGEAWGDAWYHSAVSEGSCWAVEGWNDREWVNTVLQFCQCCVKYSAVLWGATHSICGSVLMASDKVST